jgi:hypothetical protein
MAVVIDPTTGITAPAATISGALSAGSVASTTEAFTNTPAVSTAQSMVRLNTANGYGSTNIKIRRFTNVVTNQGSDITYADSATLGATFTINTNGVYAISFTEQFNAGTYAGISLNSTELTTAIYSIAYANRLAMSLSVNANYPVHISSCLYLSSGSVIRAHCDGTPSGTSPDYSSFTITRVS